MTELFHLFVGEHKNGGWREHFDVSCHETNIKTSNMGGLVNLFDNLPIGGVCAFFLENLHVLFSPYNVQGVDNC